MNLTKAEQRNKVLAEILREIEVFKASSIASLLEIGKRYLRIKDEKLFFPEHSSFRKFIAKETPVSYGTVYNYINIYLAYGQDDDVLRVQEPTRLIRSLPHIKNNVKQLDNEKAKDWLHKALTLNTQDFQDELREADGKKKTLVSECLHNDTQDISITQCRKCGKRLRYDDGERRFK